MNRTILIHTITGVCLPIGEQLLKDMMTQVLTYPLVGHEPNIPLPDLILRREAADKIIRHLDNTPE